MTEPSCPGDSDGSIVVTVSGGTPAYDYVWSNNVFQRINADLPAGTYTLTLTDHNNCSLSRIFELSTPDTVKIVTVDLSDPTCSGVPDGTITIHADGGSGDFTYSYNNGDSYEADSVMIKLNSGTYSLLVKDINGCISEGYAVTLTKSESCKLVIFDAFSPNHDGLNDVWHIGNIDNYPSCKVKIFNSWGTPVFSSKGYGTAWDGKNNGNDLPTGTYYYVIDPGDGSKSLSGPVSLVK
jgi:gliding motility-associated-like protein